MGSELRANNKQQNKEKSINRAKTTKIALNERFGRTGQIENLDGTQQGELERAARHIGDIERLKTKKCTN